MKSQELKPILLAMVGPMLLPLTVEATLPVYKEGHSDIIPIYEMQPDRFELKIRFDPSLKFEDGSPIEDRIVDASSVAIRVGDPPLIRGYDVGDPDDIFDDIDRSGPKWDFVGVEVDDYFWNLNQGSTPGFPFMGIASDTLTPASQWSSDLVWSLREVTLAPEVDGVSGEVSLWQNDGVGQPDGVYFVSLDGVDEGDDFFNDSIGGHDHYNWSFTLPGVYEVVLGLNAMHSTAGEVDGTTTLTFLVGDDTSQTDPTSQPGDFNGDGTVNLADYTVWRDNLGGTENGFVLGGNGNGGVVDASDYLDWKNLFGTVYTSNLAASTQLVPEPTSLFGTIFGFVLLLRLAPRTGRCM